MEWANLNIFTVDVLDRMYWWPTLGLFSTQREQWALCLGFILLHHNSDQSSDAAPRVILEASPVPARKAQNKLQCSDKEKVQRNRLYRDYKCSFLTLEIKEQYLNVPLS